MTACNTTAMSTKSYFCWTICHCKKALTNARIIVVFDNCKLPDNMAFLFVDIYFPCIAFKQPLLQWIHCHCLCWRGVSSCTFFLTECGEIWPPILVEMPFMYSISIVYFVLLAIEAWKKEILYMQFILYKKGLRVLETLSSVQSWKITFIWSLMSITSYSFWLLLLHVLNKLFLFC